MQSLKQPQTNGNYLDILHLSEAIWLCGWLFNYPHTAQHCMDPHDIVWLLSLF